MRLQQQPSCSRGQGVTSVADMYRESPYALPTNYFELHEG